MNRTTHLGITMEWMLVRKAHHINRANPFVIQGWVDGVQRMESAVQTASLERAEKSVITRLENIAKEPKCSKCGAPVINNHHIGRCA